MKRPAPLFVLAVQALAFLACAPPPAPEQPTWIADVEPIIRANCLSCHGSTSAALGRTRLDFYDRSVYPDSIALDPGVVGGAKDNAAILLDYVKNQDDDMRMPPSPASRLTDEQVTTLERWAAQMPPARGQRMLDYPPTAQSVEPPAWRDGKLTLSVATKDGDHEAVFGLVTAGPGSSAAIDGSGVQAITLSGTPAKGAQIAAYVSDGWTTLPYSLGLVPAPPIVPEPPSVK